MAESKCVYRVCLLFFMYICTYICIYYVCMYAIRTRRTRATRCCSCCTVSVSTGPCRAPRRSSSSASSRARTCPRWTTAGIYAILRRSMIDWGCLDLHNGRFDYPFCTQYIHTYLFIFSNFLRCWKVLLVGNLHNFFPYIHTHIIYTYKQTYIHTYAHLYMMNLWFFFRRFMITGEWTCAVLTRAISPCLPPCPCQTWSQQHPFGKDDLLFIHTYIHA